DRLAGQTSGPDVRLVSGSPLLARHGARVHISRQRSQAADRRLLLGEVGKRVPAHEAGRVLPAELVEPLGGRAGGAKLAEERLGRVRPQAVRVRVVRLEGNGVDPDLVT